MGDAGHLLEAGSACFRSGNWSDARTLLFEYVREKPYSGSRKLSDALLMLAKMDYFPDRWVYRSVAECPENPDALAFLAKCLIRDGCIDDAKRVAVRAVGLGAEDAVLEGIERADPDVIDSWAAVVPTRSEYPDMLHDVVNTIGPERVVIVHTVDNDVSPDVSGCINVRDTGDVNIQRWWNSGMSASGARYIAFVNDDIKMRKNYIPTLVWECWFTNTSLARIANYIQRQSGHFFVIDRSNGIKPDERFRWWYGDDDLYQQAQQKNGIAEVDINGIWHKGGSANERYPEFKIMTENDYVEYVKKWRIS